MNDLNIIETLYIVHELSKLIIKNHNFFYILITYVR